MESKNIGNLLIAKGEKHYAIGKLGIVSLIVGLGLAVVVCLLGIIIYGKIYFLTGLGITVFASVLSIVLTVVGIFLLPFYFFGLHYLGLGRICNNTEK